MLMKEQEQKDANWTYNADAPDTAQPEDQIAPQKPVSNEPITWSASEYVAHEKSPAWYLTLFAGGGLLVLIVFIVTRDVLASVVVLLSCAALSVYAGRKPETKRYSLTDQGVTVEGKPYAYSMFRSFSVVEEGAIDSIWLKPLKRFSPMTVMYFAPEDADQIVDMISQYLPYEEHELDTIDRISKRVRF